MQSTKLILLYKSTFANFWKFNFFFYYYYYFQSENSFSGAHLSCVKTVKCAKWMRFVRNKVEQTIYHHHQDAVPQRWSLMKEVSGGGGGFEGCGAPLPLSSLSSLSVGSRRSQSELEEEENRTSWISGLSQSLGLSPLSSCPSWAGQPQTVSLLALCSIYFYLFISLTWSWWRRTESEPEPGLCASVLSKTLYCVLELARTAGGWLFVRRLLRSVRYVWQLFVLVRDDLNPL